MFVVCCCAAFVLVSLVSCVCHVYGVLLSFGGVVLYLFVVSCVVFHYGVCLLCVCCCVWCVVVV